MDDWLAGGLTGRPPIHDISGDTSDFHLNQRLRHLHRAVVLDVKMTGLDYVRTRERARRDAVDGIWIECAQGSGGDTLITAAGKAAGGAGATTVVDLAQPYVRYARDAHFLAINLDRSLLREADIEALRGTVFGGVRARIMADYLRLLIDGGDPEPARFASSLSAVVAAIGAGSRNAAREAAQVLGPLVKIQAVRYIDAHLNRERILVGEIVAASGASRATLYRLFEPHGGLARFVWSRRLESARALISDPAETRSLAEISESLGFTDPAHFSRAFKLEFGLRPSDLRPFR